MTEPRTLWERRADNVAAVRLAIAMEQVQRIIDTPNATKHKHASKIVDAMQAWLDECRINAGEHSHVAAEMAACASDAV